MMSHRVSGKLLISALLVLGWAGWGSALAEVEPIPLDNAPATKPTTQADPGVPFESPAAGISMRLPSSGKIIRRTGGDEIVRYVNEEKQQVLNVTRTSLSKPLHLSKARDPHGQQAPGILDLTLDEFLQNNPGAKVLRQDLANIRDANVGMLVMRHTIGTQRRLTQQAIIQADSQLYYILTFTSVGAAKAVEDEVDVNEQDAVETFGRILDSVRLLDRGSIRDEQERRLFAARAFFVNLREPQLRKALVPEQWLRLIKDGKDIGYTYIVEELGNESDIRAGQRAEGTGEEKGVLIGVRSRSVPEPGRQVDAESWLYCSFDRHHEAWSNLVVFDDGKPKKDFATEFGSSDRRTKPVTDPADPTGNTFQTVDIYTLNATYMTRSTNIPPIERELPPWYMPQAIGHLLPRLVPLREPKQYMFAIYSSGDREVKHRYLDVQREQEVTFNGKKFRAVPVSERVGYESDPTVHYIAPDGRYLGSENRAAGIAVVPTDANTLRKIWTNPNLARPDISKEGDIPEIAE